jgi:predicted dehydrogenase
MQLWLIGSGPMAQDYGKVLQALQIDFVVIGRGKISAKNFQEDTGISVKTGGLTQALDGTPAPEMAIVAVGVEQLATATMELLQAGTKKILLEKPGGLNVAELIQLNQCAIECDARVWLAYNRRFYSSTSRAEEIIMEDGGATSFHFEFTEWSHQIQHVQKAPGVLEHWVLGNSSHVLDLAFYLGGFPTDWKGWSKGELGWHPASSRFCGAGVTERGTLFSYIADWEAPGRWGVEIMTRKNRLIFRPMEQLQVISLGSVREVPVKIDDQLNQECKPGLYRQTQAFLHGHPDRFCTLADQVKHARLYSEIAGYLL